MAYFTFSSPLYLNFLFLIPLLILIHVWTLRGRHKRAITFANIEAIERVSGAELFSRNLTPLFLTISVVACLTLALAGTTFHIERKASAFSYVLALDASPSMTATDVLPSRLFAAKQAAKAFVDAVPLSTKVGIVSFSGVSYIELTLTDDKRVLKDTIDALDIKAVGGTNILDALITSVNIMEGEDAKAVVLLSDGQLNVNTVEDILRYAKRSNVILHTLGIGTLEGGEAEYFISKLDEDALKALAYNTRGKYYHVLDQDTLKRAFDDIAVSTESLVGIALSVYLLIGSFVLIVVQWVLVNTRWRGIP